MRLLPFSALFICMSHAAPLIIAHRGASHAAPENTQAAFELAWKEGADGIEGDFRLTSDGHIVCIHDPDTKRTTGKKFAVAATPLATLRQLDAGSWKDPAFSGEKIPLLSEILTSLPADKYFVVELKCGPEIVPPLRKVLKEHAADPQRVILIAFDAEVVRAAREQIPDFPAHLVSNLDKIHLHGTRKKFMDLYQDCGATGLQFKHTAKFTGDWLASFRGKGHLTACWTVDTPEAAVRARDLGLDFITTNRPAFIREALESAP